MCAARNTMPRAATNPEGDLDNRLRSGKSRKWPGPFAAWMNREDFPTSGAIRFEEKGARPAGDRGAYRLGEKRRGDGGSPHRTAWSGCLESLRSARESREGVICCLLGD